ncbi:MAG TPA: acyl-CoA dehydrogenase family protein [Jatrophihabitantaceae bacterium]|nr:acyl-CoA dehydrogenase family protein [Jatrophihabitantaceae bacterium]
MDFTLSETQHELAALTRQIVTDQMTQDRLKALERQPSHFDRDLYAALAHAGVLAAALPESIGGGGLDLLEQCSVLVELGREVAPVPYLESIVLSAAAIGHFGTDAQREQWAKPAADGALVLVPALSEDLVDSMDRPTTRAERSGDTWTITGTKAVVPFGAIADAFVIPAVSDDGPSLFIVAADAPGLTITPEVYVDGDQVASLELSRVRVDESLRFGNFDILHWLSVRATIGTCALQLGVLERALELTVEYARERKQFDRPIGSFQAVAQRMADAYIDVEALRLTMWQAAWRKANAVHGMEPMSTAKFWAAEAGHHVAHTAVHVHGGAGIDVDAPTHRYFLAAKRNEFLLGSGMTHLRALGAVLAATPA